MKGWLLGLVTVPWLLELISMLFLTILGLYSGNMTKDLSWVRKGYLFYKKGNNFGFRDIARKAQKWINILRKKSDCNFIYFFLRTIIFFTLVNKLRVSKKGL